MKKIILFLALLPSFAIAQFDFYGPQPFGEILENSFSKSWTPIAVPNIENRNKIILLDQATMTQALMLNTNNKTLLEIHSIDSVTNGTYGSMLRSVFQLEDKNTHQENDISAQSGSYFPLSGQYKLTPFLHSYYALNTNSGIVNLTDAGSFYIHENSNSGYLLVELNGTPNSTTIEAVSKWEYNVSL